MLHTATENVEWKKLKQKIVHNIFSDFFIAMYLYNKIYKKKRNIIGMNYLEYQNKETFDLFIKYYLNNENEPWPNVFINLLYKIDYDMFIINGKSPMNEENLSYKTFKDFITNIFNMENNVLKNMFKKVINEGKLY